MEKLKLLRKIEELYKNNVNIIEYLKTLDHRFLVDGRQRPQVL